MKWFSVIFGIFLAVSHLMGHVGNLNVFYEGTAGPYPVRVIIRPPGVVPGLAEITVRALGEGVNRVTVQPIKFDAGPEGAPPPDEAVPISDDKLLYSSELWLMDFGSYSVNVHLYGEKGHGTVIVPVNSIATRTLEMAAGLKAILLILMILLVGGGVSVIAAAARESTFEAGQLTNDSQIRRGRIAFLVGAIFCVGMLLGGRNWWSTVEAQYRANMFKPLKIESQVRLENKVRILSVNIVDDRWTSGRLPPLIPDHGKLMHMYFIRLPKFDGFAHIHPKVQSDGRFDVIVPPLPDGEYAIFADITHETGFSQTLIDTVTVPEYHPDEELLSASLERDMDDSWREIKPYSKIPQSKDVSFLEDGSTMTWLNMPDEIAIDEELEWQFRVNLSGGSPAVLEPYMGMMSHCAVLRTDGKVFVHMHPTGTISMASQVLFERQAGEMDHSMHGQMQGNENQKGTVTFPPFEFSEAGDYRIWIQVKVGGKVLSGYFDVKINPSRT